MIPLVVDASVAGKWLLPEKHSDAARSLIDSDYALQVPDLIYPEVANILWKRVRRGELSSDEAQIALLTLATTPLIVHPSIHFISRALDLAIRTVRTAYDSLYLALAMETSSRVVTADERFYNSVRSGPFASYVAWVEDPSGQATPGETR